MTTLNQLCEGQRARVVRLNHGSVAYRRRLLALGLTPNTTLTILRLAPMGDPVEIHARGSNLSLRRTEACMIEVEAIQ